MAEYKPGVVSSNVGLQMAEIRQRIEERQKEEADIRAVIVTTAKL